LFGQQEKCSAALRQRVVRAIGVNYNRKRCSPRSQRNWGSWHSARRILRALLYIDLLKNRREFVCLWDLSLLLLLHIPLFVGLFWCSRRIPRRPSPRIAHTKKSGIVSQLRRDNCQHLVQQNKTIDEGLCSSLKITQLCCSCSWLTASPSERVEKRTTDQVLGCSVECRRLVFRTAFLEIFPKRSRK
jgi:hypothetical protein